MEVKGQRPRKATLPHPWCLCVTGRQCSKGMRRSDQSKNCSSQIRCLTTFDDSIRPVPSAGGRWTITAWLPTGIRESVHYTFRVPSNVQLLGMGSCSFPICCYGRNLMQLHNNTTTDSDCSCVRNLVIFWSADSCVVLRQGHTQFTSVSLKPMLESCWVGSCRAGGNLSSRNFCNSRENKYINPLPVLIPLHLSLDDSWENSLYIVVLCLIG